MQLFRQLVAVAVTISSSDGAVYRHYSYDPWGKSRNADLSDDGACNSFPAQRCDASPVTRSIRVRVDPVLKRVHDCATLIKAASPDWRTVCPARAEAHRPTRPRTTCKENSFLRPAFGPISAL
jgi:hypothetical protein